MAITLAAGEVELPQGFWDALEMPKELDVRLQPVSRQQGEDDWPFVYDRGYLACVKSLGQPIGMYVPLTDDGDVPEGNISVMLSANPFDMLPFYFATRRFFRPVADPAELIRRIAPLAETAKRLCDLPKGARAPAGDL